jgi:hypothetical protein
MHRFISMGVDCEFGVVQRHCGQEPLDLLRWGFTEWPVLNQMLRDRFCHIATPAHLSLYLKDGEYKMSNSAYGTHWHTWAGEDQIAPDRLMKREIVRLRRQADMLIDELQEGRRILVRKARSADEAAYLDEFAHRVSLYGACGILFVTVDPHRAGKVYRAGANLLRGHLSRFAPSDDIGDMTEVAPWVALCRAALPLLPARFLVTQQAGLA